MKRSGMELEHCREGEHAACRNKAVFSVVDWNNIGEELQEKINCVIILRNLKLGIKLFVREEVLV